MGMDPFFWEMLQYLGAAVGLAAFCWLAKDWLLRGQEEPPFPASFPQPQQETALELEIPVNDASSPARTQLKVARAAPQVTLKVIQGWLREPRTDVMDPPHA